MNNKPIKELSADTESDSSTQVDAMQSVRQHNCNTPVVCSAVGVPCEICGEIVIIEQGVIPEDEIDTPPLCGKCYTEYYPEYLQSLRTGYRL